jgi:WD40 repeat protein
MQSDRLKRREFITLIGGAAAWPLSTYAQTTLDTLPVIASWKSDAWQAAAEIAISPNGQFLLTSHWGMVVVWDIARGSPLITLRDHKGTVEGMAFLSEGRAATADDENEIIVWEIPSGRRVASWVGKTRTIRALAAAPDGRFIATSTDDDPSVSVWNVATRELVWSRSGLTGWVTGLAYSPEGKFVVTGQRSSVTLWDASTGSLVADIPTNAQVWSTAVSPDSRLVVAAEYNNVSVLDVASRRRIGRIEPPASSDSFFQHIALFPSGRHVAAVDTKGTTLIAEIATQRFVAKSPVASDTPVRVAISPEGRRGFVGLHNGEIQVLDLSSLQ